MKQKFVGWAFVLGVILGRHGWQAMQIQICSMVALAPSWGPKESLSAIKGSWSTPLTGSVSSKCLSCTFIKLLCCFWLAVAPQLHSNFARMTCQTWKLMQHSWDGTNCSSQRRVTNLTTSYWAEYMEGYWQCKVNKKPPIGWWINIIISDWIHQLGVCSGNWTWSEPGINNKQDRKFDTMNAQ